MQKQSLLNCSTNHMAPQMPIPLCTLKGSVHGPPVNHSRVVRPSGRRLGDLHWILQAAISFRQRIHTSRADILYADIRQLPKQE